MTKAEQVPPAARTISLSVDAGRLVALVFFTCLTIELCLVVLDLTINWLRWSDTGAIRRLFNITREDGLATLFAIVQTTMIAIVLWLTYLVKRQQKVQKYQRLGWLLLAAFFTFVLIDDGAMVHERLGTTFDEATDIELPSYAWQFAVAPAFAVAGLLIFAFLWNELPGTWLRTAIVSALTCLALALGMDFVEGMDDGYAALVSGLGWKTDTIAHFSRSAEEFLEMLAMTIFLATFLFHFTTLTDRIQVHMVHGTPLEAVQKQDSDLGRARDRWFT